MKNQGWIVFAIVGLVLVAGLALMYSGGDLKTSGEAKKLLPYATPPKTQPSDGTACFVRFSHCNLSSNTRPVLPASRGHIMIYGKIITASFDASRGLEPMCEIVLSGAKQSWPVYNLPSNWWCGEASYEVPYVPPSSGGNNTSPAPVKKLGTFILNRMPGDPAINYTINGVKYVAEVLDFANSSPNCFGSQLTTFVVNGERHTRCEDTSTILSDGSVMVFMTAESENTPKLLHIR